MGMWVSNAIFFPPHLFLPFLVACTGPDVPVCILFFFFPKGPLLVPFQTLGLKVLGPIREKEDSDSFIFLPNNFFAPCCG